jgi:hypothetical protein
VSVSGVVSASFSEPVQPGTVVLGVRDPGGTAVGGSLAYDAGTGRAAFTPSGRLA